MAELEQVEAVADPIGAKLRSAREAQGLSLDDVAAKTRIPIRHLVHIEKGEWEQLPALTYSVGFARAYATAVGLEPAEIGAEVRAQLAGSQAPIPAYYEPADPARVPPRWLALVAAVIAVLLIGGYFVWRSNVLGGDQDQVTQAETATAPAGTAPGQPANGQPQPAAPPAQATGPVVLTATADVWLRVYDADRHKLLEKTMKAGERFEVPANANRPQLLTGRPNALQVTVGSTQIPALGPPEKTVADVSLLPADLLARSSGQPAAAPSPAPAAGATRPTAPPPQPRRGSAPPAAAQPSEELVPTADAPATNTP
jgi:cytoskeletal protein RodZ